MAKKSGKQEKGIKIKKIVCEFLEETNIRRILYKIPEELMENCPKNTEDKIFFLMVTIREGSDERSFIDVEYKNLLMSSSDLSPHEYIKFLIKKFKFSEELEKYFKVMYESLIFMQSKDMKEKEEDLQNQCMVKGAMA